MFELQQSAYRICYLLVYYLDTMIGLRGGGCIVPECSLAPNLVSADLVL